jgi:K+-sensing histidine kinase KdpD
MTRADAQGMSASRPARRRGTIGARPAGRTGRVQREAFLGILSHELRTPVTTIYAGSQMLASRDLDRARARAVATDIVVEAERLYRLVEDLLVLARLENGALEPDQEPVAVGHVVIEAIDREVVLGEGVRIGFAGPRDVTATSADRGLVTHVVRNLLDNAIRYGDAGPVEVVVVAGGDEIAVRVLDRGDRPGTGGHEAFEMDPAVPAAPAQGAGGGIGLFVAGRLVEAMGGRVWAAPRDGGGSEFGFVLPRTA